MLGNHLARRCGIATFTTDLRDAIDREFSDLDTFVVATNDVGHVLELLRELRMPVVTTLHTILAAPDAALRSVMDALLSLSPSASSSRAATARAPPQRARHRPVEDRRDPPRHSRRARSTQQGQARRRRPGVDANVIFLNRFVSHEALVEFLGAADLYITPYLKQEQSTSGTLAYAVGCGKATISTPYRDARELLADRRGILVPWRDAARRRLRALASSRALCVHAPRDRRVPPGVRCCRQGPVDTRGARRGRPLQPFSSCRAVPRPAPDRCRRSPSSTSDTCRSPS